MNLEPGTAGRSTPPAREGPRASPPRPRRPFHSRPRLDAAPDQLVAGPGRNVDPRVLLVVAPRGAGARGVGGLAVVLAGFGDAVALLGLELRLRRRAGLTVRDHRHGERRDHGGRNEQVLLHVALLSVKGFSDASRGQGPRSSTSGG